MVSSGTIDGERGTVVVPLRLVDAMLATILADTRADGLPPEHAALVLEFVLADALDVLEAALGCRLSIAALYDVGAHAPHASALVVTAEVGDLGPLPCEIAPALA